MFVWTRQRIFRLLSNCLAQAMARNPPNVPSRRRQQEVARSNSKPVSNSLSSTSTSVTPRSSLVDISALPQTPQPQTPQTPSTSGTPTSPGTWSESTPVLVPGREGESHERASRILAPLLNLATARSSPSDATPPNVNLTEDVLGQLKEFLQKQEQMNARLERMINETRNERQSANRSRSRRLPKELTVGHHLTFF